MPRTIDVTAPTEKTDQLVGDIKQLQGLIGLRLQRGASLQPPGDVITIETTNRSLPTLMQLLERHGAGRESGLSITTSAPISVISPSSASAIVSDVSESTWEEMEIVMAKESNMTVNAMLVMAISGILAAIGIATNALHIVIGAMVIAPGFEPITRLSLGVMAQGEAWQRGLSDTAKGYVALIVGAALATVVLRLLGQSPLGGEASYLPARVLISYWTTITASSLIVTAVASAAGALLIATNRSVLTAGVMIALALVPAAAITGMALVSGDMALAGQGALRWGIDVGLVAILSALVLLWKRARVQRRKMML